MFLLLFFGVLVSAGPDIRNLAGEPDYRQVRLHWEVEDEPDSYFQIRYCELQTWGSQRCRTQAVSGNEGNDIEHAKVYSADVKGLRMATTYSFEVKKAKEQTRREDRAEGDDKNENIIVIPTKGFSARATQCLPEASEIEVSTGPHFGGRIAVEASDGERCVLDGDAASPRDTYTLRINHAECGSRVNDTTVATFVIVQENLPILTHSTRRFLVLCTYQPETLTVRAGINLPTGNGKGGAQAHAGTARRGRNLRTGKLMQKPQALVDEEPVPPDHITRANPVPTIVIAMLSIAAVIGTIAIALKITRKKLMGDMDNISIASEVSTSSCSTTPDIETLPKDTKHQVIYV